MLLTRIELDVLDSCRQKQPHQEGKGLGFAGREVEDGGLALGLGNHIVVIAHITYGSVLTVVSADYHIVFDLGLAVDGHPLGVVVGLLGPGGLELRTFAGAGSGERYGCNGRAVYLEGDETVAALPSAGHDVGNAFDIGIAVGVIGFGSDKSPVGYCSSSDLRSVKFRRYGGNIHGFFSASEHDNGGCAYQCYSE